MNKPCCTLFLFTLLFLLDTVSFSQPALDWQQKFGGSDYDYGQAIVRTPDDGFLIACDSRSSDFDATGNHGYGDCMLVKLDQNKNVQWIKNYGGSMYDTPKKLIITSDGNYLMAGFSGSNDFQVYNHKGAYDAWIVKIDTSGNILWGNCYGGSAEDYAYSVVETVDGSFVCAGTARSNNIDVSGNNGSYDIWLFKIDANGNLIWSKCFGSAGSEFSYDVIVDEDGNYVAVGAAGSYAGILLRVDTAGNQLNFKSYANMHFDIFRRIFQLSDHGFIVAGNMDILVGSSNYYEYWVVKVDSMFNLVYNKHLGSSGSEILTDFNRTDDGNFILAGHSNKAGNDVSVHYRSEDIWFAKIDEDANIIWEKTIGGSRDDFYPIITEEIDGVFMVASTTNSVDIDVRDSAMLWDVWVFEMTENINTISGRTFYDFNLNYIYDAGDVPMNQHMVNSAPEFSCTYSNIDGSYQLLYFDTGYVSITTPSINYYQLSPTSRSAYFANFNLTDSLNDFAFRPVTTVFDLAVNVTASRMRPGFNSAYTVHYYNCGTLAQSGVVSVKLDTNISFLSASVTPDTVISDSIVWNVGALNPAFHGNITILVHADSSLNIGDVAETNSWITPVVNDAFADNNYERSYNTLVASFDPNDITCNRDSISINEVVSGAYPEYIIRFQNTGNDTAFNVSVLNNLPPFLDETTFELIQASHECSISYNNSSRLFTFNFDGINLPDSSNGNFKSNGFIRYRAKIRQNINSGDSIMNKALIVFDFNDAVATNTAVTYISPVITSAGKSEIAQLVVYPNPAANNIYIRNTVKGKQALLEIYDSTGRTVQVCKNVVGSEGINITSLPDGFYFIKVTDDTKNIYTGKFIKSSKQ